MTAAPGTQAHTSPRAATPTAGTSPVDAPPHAYDAVLFASFGGPEGPEDVMPFLRNVTRGRGIPDERLEEVSHHYLALGGRSPINEQNRHLIAALEAELASRGIDLPVYWGNRNWEPYTARTVAQMHADGHERVLGLVTSAYSSYSSCRQYREDFGKALAENDLFGRLSIDKVRVYMNMPGFLDPVTDGVAAALSELAAEGHAPERTRILFSTHSIPLTMADASGPEETREEGSGGWYVAQHLAACRYVIEQLAARADRADATASPWELVYQSRSGAPHIPWLEPDINDVIERLASDGGTDAVVVVPIGFVTDHVEVVWDLDNEAKESAEEHHLGFRRVATAGGDPRFVAGLVDLIEERLGVRDSREVVTDFPACADICGVNCRRTARGPIVPTTSAVDSPADIATAVGPEASEQYLAAP